MVTEKRANNPAGGQIADFQSGFVQLSDRIIEILLISLLVFMPFAFGVVHDWSMEIVVILCSGLLFVFLARQVFSGQGFVSTWSYVLIAAFIILTVFTILPLPEKITSIISPQTVSLKTELLGDVQNHNFTLSFYPHGTKSGLRIILCAAAVFVVVLNVFKSGEQIKRLLKAVVFIAAAVALLAIAQDILGNGKLYWLVPISQKTFSGPFVNHSHFGQFMNLSIGAALALVLLILHGRFSGESVTPAGVFEYFESEAAKELWLLVAMISVSAAAVFASLTRGGMISMIIAICITTILLSARRAFRQHGWIVVIIALAALICLLYTGFDTVYERFAAITALDGYATRFAVLADMTEPVRRFLFFGTGLGSYAIIYPMFQSIYTALQFSHAENEYAQLLQETGLTGLVIMLIFAAIVIVNFTRAIRNRKSPINVAVYGLGFGLIAILIHSAADFGQHLPANAMLTAIFCALIITLGRHPVDTQTINMVRLKKPVLLVLSLVLACVYGRALLDANKARIGEGWWHKAYVIETKLLANHRNGSDEDFASILSYAAKAVQIQPENIEYRYWLNVWKWWDISRKTYFDTGELTNEATGEVYGIVDELKKIRTVCPTFGPVYCLMGQLQKFVLFEAAGEDNIKKGFMLEPNNEISLFAAGCLNISDGQIEKSFEKFSKSIGLGGTYFRDIVRIYIEQEERADYAVEIAANDTKRLKYVADVLSKNGNFPAERLKAVSKLIELARQKAADKTADIGDLVILGNYYIENNNNQKAVEYLTAAVAADYGNANLRLKLAKAMAENGQAVDAIGQLRVALKLKPKFRQAENLLAELSVRPEVIKQSISDTDPNKLSIISPGLLTK